MPHYPPMRLAILFASVLCACRVATAADVPVELDPFRDGAKWGFATPSKGPFGFGPRNWSMKNEVVIPAQYAWVGYFRNGLARVTNEGTFEAQSATISNPKWGFIDATGREVIPMQFSRADDFRGDHAIVELNHAFGLIDKTGAMIVPALYKSVEYFSDNRARVETDAGIGFCDPSGTEVITLRYQNADQFRNGMSRVRRDGKFAWIDIHGNEVAFGKFDHIEIFSEQLAGFQKDGKWGFADFQGEVAIAPAWDAVSPFSQRLAAVKLGNKWGFIDKSGKTVIQPSFDSADGFDANDLAIVGVEKEYTYIRRDGSFAFTQRFTVAYPFDHGVAKVVFGKHSNYLDLSGTLKPVEYSRQWMSRDVNFEPSSGLDFFLMYGTDVERWRW